MRSLEGANCADLPPQIADKYFDCDVRKEPLKAMVARAICAHCPVTTECRSEALAMPKLPPRGVIGGVNVAEVHAARQWRVYEQGVTERVPGRPRPDWLPMPDAAQRVEQHRLEADRDEPPPEQ